MKKNICLLLIIAMVFLTSGCKKKTTEAIESVTKSVKVLTVTEKPFVSTRMLLGTAEAIEDVQVAPQLSGVIESVWAKEGDAVTTRSVLAKINEVMAKATYDKAEANYQLMHSNDAKQQALYTKQMISDQQMEVQETQLQAARADLEMASYAYQNATLKCPIVGVVAEVAARKGEFASAGKPLFRIVNLNQIKLTIGITEEELKWVRRQTRVTVSFPSLSETKAWIGTVTFVSPINDSSAKTYPVEIRMDNPSGIIKPGMRCSVQMVKQSIAEAIVIPQDAMIQEKDSNYVYIVKNNRAYKKTVDVVGTQDDSSAVTGISAGDALIVVGQKSISDGETVRIIE